MIHGPNSVDNPLAREAISGSDFGVPGIAAIQGTALFHQLWTGSPVDGTIDTTSAKERLIGRVDDAVDLQFGYVIANERDCVIEDLRGARRG